MFRKLFVVGFVVVLFMVMTRSFGLAHIHDYQNEELSILFVYSTLQDEKSPNVKKIDMLLRHFTKHVYVVSEHGVKEEDFAVATHLFYYGEHEQTLNETMLASFKAFDGPIIAIGENVEQIPGFYHVKQNEERRMNAVSFDGENKWTIPLTVVKKIVERDEHNVLLYGHRGEETFPLFVQSSTHYYLAVKTWDSVIQNVVAELLHDILPNNHQKAQLAYLRLEDIHPLTDPKKLLEVGEYLNERGIPYLLIVIPVYISPDTGEIVSFSRSPELVQVLQHLQNSGGTVVAHGYTHQYRESETGEGFEFWDVENDQFITSVNPKVETEYIKTKDYFANREDYEMYLDALKQKEREYLEKKLNDSIHELVRYGLYPLSFEAPHYTMSQQGYTLVANFFSSIFGEMQLSDQNWAVMDAPPYVSTSENLRGMTLYPETIGYVDPSLPNPFQQTEQRIEQALIVRDGVIGAFYHPYLGLDYLPEFISKFETIPNLMWLDLKKTKQRVKTKYVDIVSDGTGDILIKDNTPWWYELKTKQKSLSVVEVILWVVTVVVLLFVCMFLLFSVYLRTRVRKRLFRERKSIG